MTNMGRMTTLIESPPITGVIEIMDRSGDTKVTWSRHDTDEVDNARRTFHDLRAKGFIAYSVDPRNDRRGEVLHTFDETAERIVMSPAMQGG